MLMMGESGEANAKMSCGQVISVVGMTQFLQSCISAQEYKIKCPGKHADGSPCGSNWDFRICLKIAQVTPQEKQML